MSKYRKMPIVIEAWRAGSGEIEPYWLAEAVLNGQILFGHDGSFRVRTLEGVMSGKKDDYIIKGVQGELYPCKPDIFEATYEKVEERYE